MVVSTQARTRYFASYFAHAGTLLPSTYTLVSATKMGSELGSRYKTWRGLIKKTVRTAVGGAVSSGMGSQSLRSSKGEFEWALLHRQSAGQC